MLTLKNTAHEGEAEARWSRVSNVQFYEVKAYDSTSNDSPGIIPWDTLPVLPVRPASLLLKGLPVGSYLTVRVRAIGAKGPSPGPKPTPSAFTSQPSRRPRRFHGSSTNNTAVRLTPGGGVFRFCRNAFPDLHRVNGFCRLLPMLPSVRPA
jgi:hypothetical protein